MGDSVNRSVPGWKPNQLTLAGPRWAGCAGRGRTARLPCRDEQPATSSAALDVEVGRDDPNHEGRQRGSGGGSRSGPRRCGGGCLRWPPNGVWSPRLPAQPEQPPGVLPGALKPARRLARRPPARSRLVEVLRHSEHPPAGTPGAGRLPPRDVQLCVPSLLPLLQRIVTCPGQPKVVVAFVFAISRTGPLERGSFWRSGSAKPFLRHTTSCAIARRVPGDSPPSRTPYDHQY